MAGKGRDVSELINVRFHIHDLEVVYFKTTHKNNAYEIAQSMNLGDYSALLVIGGDGTMSEAISGMLSRKDKKKLPIGLVPNGYSNDLCASLGIKSLDQALDFILKRESIPIDAVRVLIDVESEESLPSDSADRLTSCRYMMTGA